MSSRVRSKSMKLAKLVCSVTCLEACWILLCNSPSLTLTKSETFQQKWKREGVSQHLDNSFSQDQGGIFCETWLDSTVSIHFFPFPFATYLCVFFGNRFSTEIFFHAGIDTIQIKVVKSPGYNHLIWPPSFECGIEGRLYRNATFACTWHRELESSIWNCYHKCWWKMHTNINDYGIWCKRVVIDDNSMKKQIKPFF